MDETGDRQPTIAAFTIATRTGYSERHTQTALRILERRGLTGSQAVKDGRGYYQTSKRWVIRQTAGAVRLAKAAWTAIGFERSSLRSIQNEQRAAKQRSQHVARALQGSSAKAHPITPQQLETLFGGYELNDRDKKDIYLFLKMADPDDTGFSQWDGRTITVLELASILARQRQSRR